MQKIRLYRSRLLLILFILLAAALCALIFVMSSESAEISGARSTSIVVRIVYFFVPDLDRHIPPEDLPAFFSTLDNILRKIAHFSLYALLGILLFLISVYREKPLRVHFFTGVCGAALYALTDEVHQAFSPGRGPRFYDVLLDSAGAACGILLLIWFLRRLWKRKTTHETKI